MKIYMSTMCPTLHEETLEQVNNIGGFPSHPQQKYDPYSNTYNCQPPFQRQQKANISEYTKLRESSEPTRYHSEYIGGSSSSKLNPREDVSVIYVKSRKQLEAPSQKQTTVIAIEDDINKYA